MSERGFEHIAAREMSASTDFAVRAFRGLETPPTEAKERSTWARRVLNDLLAAATAE